VFRFAPSPNGHLHLGHAYSALLNVQLAAEQNGRFLLRMEDIDMARCTRSLARDALEDLAWLGLAWEEPVRFQSEHMADYQAAQDALMTMGVLYPCWCSRREIDARCGHGPRDPDHQPLYDGHCRSNQRSTDPQYALRLDMARAAALAGNDAARSWGDIILVRKDIGTSYHVAVVVDDALQGVTDVVRGKDLEAATCIHLLLQHLLGLSHPRYRHHELITDLSGLKLSKSAGSRSLRSLRDAGITAAEIRAELGF